MHLTLSFSLLLFFASLYSAGALQAAGSDTLQVLVTPALAHDRRTELPLDGDAAQRRQLAQVASVCPATEYFCGADDLILDSAFQALGSSACVEDAGAPRVSLPAGLAECRLQLAL